MNAGSGSDTVTTTANFYNNFGAKLTVNGAANTLPLHALSAGTLAATEGSAPTNAVATFSDPNGTGAAGDDSATINWGDGGSTTTGTINGPDPNGVFTVSASHAYAAASAMPTTLSVVVHRANATDVTVTDTASVADAPLSGAAASITPTEQATFTGAVATFIDGNYAALPTGFTATIDWGDGATTTGTVTSAGDGFQVTGAYAYTKSGTDNITVVINDTGGSSATVTSTATVSVAPTNGSGDTLSGTAGTAVSGAIATFTHGDGSQPASGFTATIDWGDGKTSAGTVSETGGTYTVAASHTYDASGTFMVKTIHRGGGVLQRED